MCFPTAPLPTPLGLKWEFDTKILPHYSGGYRRVAMVLAETPSERAHAPNQRWLVSRRAKM